MVAKIQKCFNALLPAAKLLSNKKDHEEKMLSQSKRGKRGDSIHG